MLPNVVAPPYPKQGEGEQKKPAGLRLWLPESRTLRRIFFGGIIQ